MVGAVVACAAGDGGGGRGSSVYPDLELTTDSLLQMLAAPSRMVWTMLAGDSLELLLGALLRGRG